METLNSPQQPQHKRKFNLTKNQLCAILAGVLVISIALCLFAFSPWAKYGTSATGNDGARVARFEVNTATSQTDLDLQLGYTVNSKDYAFSVSNQSSDGTILNEVTTNYDVIVTFPSAVDSSVVALTLKNSAKPETSTTPLTPTASSDNKTYTFSKAGTFEAASGATHNITLTFKLTDSALAGTLTPTTWSGVKVDVKATQVD